MPPADTDEQLLHRFADGERAAFGILAARYERSLLGLATGLLGGRTDLACDAVQETWVRVIRFADSFDGRAAFKSWLYRIAINQCRNLIAAGRPQANIDAVAAPAGDAPGPAAAAESVERAQTLRTAVAQLTHEKRLVVLLCYHNGMTHQQAGEILDIPVGTLKSRLSAALTELRESLPREMKP